MPVKNLTSLCWIHSGYQEEKGNLHKPEMAPITTSGKATQTHNRYLAITDPEKSLGPTKEQNHKFLEGLMEVRSPAKNQAK